MGAACAMKLYGVEILNEGSGVSIDDAITEMQATFVARSLEPWQAVVSAFQSGGGGDSVNNVSPNLQCLRSPTTSLSLHCLETASRARGSAANKGLSIDRAGGGEYGEASLGRRSGGAYPSRSSAEPPAEPLFWESIDDDAEPPRLGDRGAGRSAVRPGPAA